jgi:hypothetical protein
VPGRRSALPCYNSKQHVVLPAVRGANTRGLFSDGLKVKSGFSVAPRNPKPVKA